MLSAKGWLKVMAIFVVTWDSAITIHHQLYDGIRADIESFPHVLRLTASVYLIKSEESAYALSRRFNSQLTHGEQLYVVPVYVLALCADLKAIVPDDVATWLEAHSSSDSTTA